MTANESFADHNPIRKLRISETPQRRRMVQWRLQKFIYGGRTIMGSGLETKRLKELLDNRAGAKFFL